MRCVPESDPNIALKLAIKSGQCALVEQLIGDARVVEGMRVSAVKKAKQNEKKEHRRWQLQNERAFFA
jgi:hypothetical protein